MGNDGGSAGNLTVAGTFTPTGAITANAGVVVDNITIDGTEIDLSSGDLLIDVAGDITLDAGGFDVFVAANGTNVLSFQDNNGDGRILATGSDKDLLFMGNDGGSVIEMGRFDSSTGGEFRIGTQSGNPGSGDDGIIMVPSAGILITSDGQLIRGYSLNSGGTVFSVTAAGAVSKQSGSFRIKHPVPSKTSTHYLVHSFVEAPEAANIYRGKVALSSGTATVNLDTSSGMSEGSFEALNRDVQCFTSNETGWTAVKGAVSFLSYDFQLEDGSGSLIDESGNTLVTEEVHGNILTITAQDNSCTDTISWLVIGQRHDSHMYDTDWTNENGRVIVEPLQTETPGYIYAD